MANVVSLREAIDRPDQRLDGLTNQRQEFCPTEESNASVLVQTGALFYSDYGNLQVGCRIDALGPATHFEVDEGRAARGDFADRLAALDLLTLGQRH